MSKDTPAEEILNHKFYVVKDSEGDYHVWSKTEYEKYINHAVRFGGASAFKLVIGFNGEESYLFPAEEVNKAQEESIGKSNDLWDTIIAMCKDDFYTHDRLRQQLEMLYDVMRLKYPVSISNDGAKQEERFQYWKDRWDYICKHNPGRSGNHIEDLINEFLSSPPDAGKEQDDKFEFVEWIDQNYFGIGMGFWVESLNDANAKKITTSELYTLYKQNK